MKLQPDHYLDAAGDRLEEARRLHDLDRWAGSVYLSGLAVEALLRAYRVRQDPEFDSRHDLAALLKESRFLEFVDPSEARAVGAWLSDVWKRWKNDYRFASTERLRSAFKALKLDRGIKGDFVKENSRQAWNAAYELVALGRSRWTS